MPESHSPGSTPVVREHKLLIDELDATVIEMLNVDTAAAIYLRKTESGNRRGCSLEVFNQWEACFRKLTTMTRYLPDLAGEKTDNRVLEYVDWWNNYTGLPTPKLLERGRKILAGYLKLLYEKGIIQIKR